MTKVRIIMTMVRIIIMLRPTFREGVSAPVMMGLHGFGWLLAS
jgi:hypothetical protein